MKVLGIAIFICVLFASCSVDQEVSVFSITYDFSKKETGANDWTGDFADYPEGDSITYELVLKRDVLPKNLNSAGTDSAMYTSGNNQSEDLFTFIKTKVKLRPNTEYEIMFNIKLASSAPTEAEGSPGESVFLKAGASVDEPQKVLQDGTYIMNIDKGNQETGGLNMITLGNIGVATTTTQFTIISRYNNNSSLAFHATTNDAGELWLIVGTDSGFNGTTTLYYTQIDVLFNQM